MLQHEQSCLMKRGWVVLFEIGVTWKLSLVFDWKGNAWNQGLCYYKLPLIMYNWNYVLRAASETTELLQWSGNLMWLVQCAPLSPTLSPFCNRTPRPVERTRVKSRGGLSWLRYPHFKLHRPNPTKTYIIVHCLKRDAKFSCIPSLCIRSV